MDVGKRITALRTAKGWTTNHLANRCGISQSFLRSLPVMTSVFRVGTNFSASRAQFSRRLVGQRIRAGRFFSVSEASRESV